MGNWERVCSLEKANCLNWSVNLSEGQCNANFYFHVNGLCRCRCFSNPDLCLYLLVAKPISDTSKANTFLTMNPHCSALLARWKLTQNGANSVQTHMLLGSMEKKRYSMQTWPSLCLKYSISHPRLSNPARTWNTNTRVVQFCWSGRNCMYISVC